MRQIDFTDLKITRLAAHEILRRKSEDKHSNVVYREKVKRPSASISGRLLSRLQEALGRDGQGFQLKIADGIDEEPDRFFNLCAGIEDLDDDNFLTRTKQIADRLAFYQRRIIIPPSHLLFLEAIDVYNNNQIVYIVIKAEYDSAFQDSDDEIEFIDNILFSKAQELYKIALLYEDDTLRIGSVPYPNDRYSAVMFDKQFNKSSGLTTYFCEDFLGFDQDGNGAIQSRLFFLLTRDFIEKFGPRDSKASLLNELKNIFLVNKEELVLPINFANLYLSKPDHKQLYKERVADALPPAIIKDASLLKGELSKSQLSFKDGIKITGDSQTFHQNVRVIDDAEKIKNLKADSTEYTVVVFTGRPFD